MQLLPSTNRRFQDISETGSGVCATRSLDLQLVVEVLVDLLGLAVLAEHAAEDAHAALPDELEGEPRVGGTPALSGAGVPALPVLHEK